MFDVLDVVTLWVTEAAILVSIWACSAASFAICAAREALDISRSWINSSLPELSIERKERE